LLSTLTPNGAGAEFVQYHHPDRLGTRLVTNAQDSTYFEQVSLPFGTALDSESTGSTNRRFTSYDRSSATGLDYANNRHYDSQQGRSLLSYMQKQNESIDWKDFIAIPVAALLSFRLYFTCGFPGLWLQACQ